MMKIVLEGASEMVDKGDVGRVVRVELADIWLTGRGSKVN